jgi:hypothetical protein
MNQFMQLCAWGLLGATLAHGGMGVTEKPIPFLIVMAIAAYLNFGKQ